jgi:hypothetical protein
MVSLIISAGNLIVGKESSGNPSKFQCNPIETNQRDVTLCEKAKQDSYFDNFDRADNPNNEPSSVASSMDATEELMTDWEQSAIVSLSVFTIRR